MKPRKEVHFNHEGQDYFISLPMQKQGNSDNQYNQVLELLEKHGIHRVYEVEEDVKGRYCSVLVNQPLTVFGGTPALPKGVELRTGYKDVYLYLPETMTIFSHDPVWLEMVDRIWKSSL